MSQSGLLIYGITPKDLEPECSRLPGMNLFRGSSLSNFQEDTPENVVHIANGAIDYHLFLSFFS